MRFIGIRRSGDIFRIQEADRERHAQCKSNIPIDTPYIIEYRPLFNKRTLKQNSYLHWLFYWISIQGNYLGMTPDDVKMFFKEKYLNVGFNEKKQRIITLDTSGLEVKRLNIFLEQIWAYCLLEDGIVCPTPDDYWSMCRNGELNSK